MSKDAGQAVCGKCLRLACAGFRCKVGLPIGSELGPMKESGGGTALWVLAAMFISLTLLIIPPPPMNIRGGAFEAWLAVLLQLLLSEVVGEYLLYPPEAV